MTDEPILTQPEHPKHKRMRQGGGGSDSVYGVGMIGAWAYYFKRAATTQQKIEAFFKGLVWPAYLVYELFVFLNKE